MSTEKDPSIYYDRANIGSSEELDEYGVWVKSEPQDVSSLDFDTGDFPGLTLPDSEEFLEDSPQVPPDFDAGFDDTAAVEDDFSFPGSEEISFDDASFGGDSAADDSFAAGSADDENDGGFVSNIPVISDEVTIEDFDDLEAVRKDMLEPQVARSGGGSAKTADGDMSTRLLMQIAEELNSIKSELSSLKSELAAVKNEVPSQFPAPLPDDPTTGSFFDEDDDETIALTGDELDNILHTADFTEEAGADAIEGLTEDDIAALNDSDFTVAENFASPPPSDAIDLSGLESRDAEELAQLREEGALPLTEAPEDTSYLENDPLAKEHSDGLSLDLSDAVIDEPDLSGEIVENPPEEPSPDALDINLDDFGELSLDDDTNASAVAIKSEPAESGDASDDFEEISFEDIGADAQTIDISSFDVDSPGDASFAEVSLDDLNSGSGNDILAEAVPQEDLTFEMLGEDAELPIKENVQDNVITDDSFETISLDDAAVPEIFEPADGSIKLDDSIDLTETPKVEGTLDLMESIELEEAVVGLDDTTSSETPDMDLDLGDTIDLGEPIELPEEAPVEDISSETKAAADSSEEPKEDAGAILGQILNQLNVELPPAGETPPPPEPEKPAGEDAGAILGQILGQLEGAPAARESAEAETAPVEKARPEKKSPKPKAAPRKKASKSKAAKNESPAKLPPEEKIEDNAEKAAEDSGESAINTTKIPKAIKTELKTVLSYMDQLLESLPEDKIEEFAQSEYFDTYKKLFEDLGIA
jgi:hypothetical protein